MRLASIHALSLIGATLGSPALLLARDDWKDALGWDGKTTTPAQLDPSNVVKPVPGVPAPAALSGGVYFCTDAGFKGSCVSHPTFSDPACPKISHTNSYTWPNLNSDKLGFSSGQCVNFGNEFNDKVTSFGPDPGLACLLWRVQQPGTVQLQRRSQLVRVQSRVIDELTMN
ncbi:hypothetical protein FRC10_003543 [Ceratobasidium sp. 414]|nr:hypothetical protein FRC10_003543 [Ceratobasidium sp. 414]